MPNRKLIVITEFYPPDYASTGQLIDELVSRLGQLGMPIRVFTSQPGYAFETANASRRERKGNAVIQRTKYSRLTWLKIGSKAINALLFVIRSFVHIVHNCIMGKYGKQDTLFLTTAPAFLPIVGYISKKLLGLSYVCLIYDLYPDLLVSLDVLPESHLLVKFWRFLNSQTWKNAEKIIVISDTMRQRILSQVPSVESKIVMIHNWADPEIIQPVKKAENWFAQQHQLTDKFVVLYSGNLGRAHDLETIMGAAQSLKNTKVKFVFIGGGFKYKQAEQQAKNLSLDNCLFLPYQDKSVLSYSLSCADLALVTIAPGLEGTIAPSKLYGIMAAGTPIAVICEQHSYLRKILKDAKCGKAIDNGDSDALVEFINQLYQDKDAKQKMGQSSRQYFEENFTPDHITQQYFDVLSSVQKQ